MAGPLVAIAIWGGSYLLDCFNTLTAANAPVEYRYTTKGGYLTLRAESYQIDLENNVVRVQDVTVREPDGKLLASLERAQIQNAIPAFLSKKRLHSIDAKLDGAFVRLERLESGQLRLLDYTPEETDEPSTLSYSVRIAPLDVAFEDYGSKPVWRRLGRFPNVRVDGAGDLWAAWTRGSVAGVGTLAADAHYDPDNGLTLEGTASDLDLAPVLKHVVSTKDVERLPVLRDVAAQRLVVNGPMRFFLPKTGEAAFEARVDAVGAGFRYGNEFSISSGKFSGLVTHAGLRGTAEASAPGLEVAYVGSFGWEDETAIGGALVARSSSLSTAPLWIRRLFPEGLNYRAGDFSGWLSYGGGDIRVDGNFKAESAVFAGERISGPLLAIAASGERVGLKLERGVWNGAPIKGAVNFNPKNRDIAGVLTADNISLATVARRFNIRNLSGSADVDALIQGKSTAPVIRVRGQGTASTVVADRRINLGSIDLAGRYINNRFQLGRLASSGQNGVFTASGSWEQRTGKLDFDVLGSNVPIGLLARDLGGTAAFSGNISGTLQNPRGEGRLEVYDAVIAKQEIPLFVADIVADKQRVAAQEFIALRGAARADGSVAMRLSDQRLSGNLTANGLQLSELLGEAFSGSVNVPTATIGGTLSSPRVDGAVDARDIVLKNIKIDEFRAEGNLANSQVQIQNANAKIGGGTLAGTGSFNLQTSTGSFTGRAEGVAVESVATDISENAAVEGTVNADISGAVANGAISRFQATGDVRDLKVNDAYVGNGQWTVGNDGAIWNASAQVGQIERFFEIANGRYDAVNDTLAADVVTHNIALENLYSAVRRYIGPEDGFREGVEPIIQVPAAVADRLATFRGNLDASMSISGSLKNPNLQVSQFEARDLTVEGRESGTVSAVANRVNGVWDIQRLTWTGGAGLLSAKGTVDEHGQTNLDGEIRNLNASWLSMWVPSLGRFTGQSDLSFLVKGPTRSPVIDTSFSYTEGDASSQDRRQVSVQANIKEGSIDAEGTYFLEGFTGPITANIPFSYPFKIPADRELSARLSLPPRELDALKEFFPWIDQARTNGTVQGEVLVAGPLDALRVTGSLNAKAEQLAMTNYVTSLLNLDATAALQGTSLNFNASANGSDGGTLRVEDAKVELGNFSEAVRQSFDALQANQVSGRAVVDNFRVVQRERGSSTAVGGLFTGAIDLSGIVREPKLTGNVEVREGALKLGEFAEVSGGSAPVINPQFDIGVQLIDELALDAGTGNFRMSGGARLGGSLITPDFMADLVVERGNIRLPTNRITIEPGGSVHVVYRATPYGAPNMQALIDMTGRTFLTAPRFGNTLERYEITLQITGDILREGGLVLNAQSDPPDLSQAQILTLLGQGEVFANRFGGSQAFNVERQLQSALVGLALPYFLGGFTDRIATNLGLDYLNVEYGAYNQVTITVAKSLGKNLVLSGSRQINNPLPGQELRYDVRLSYRLPVRNKLLNRLSFSIGFDQDRPWKIGIEYGIRF